MTNFEEGVIYEKLPMCPELRMTRYYMYRGNTLLCRSTPDREWRLSVLGTYDVLPWLTNSGIPAYLRVSEGL